MSLDIYIISPEPIKKKSTGIFTRINGQTRELTREEAFKKFPDVRIREEETETNEFWHGNITHNLTKMAKHVSVDKTDPDNYLTLYDMLWRDEYDSIITISNYIKYLTNSLFELKNNPDKYKQYNPENGWGTYEQLVEFVRSFIHALIDMPPGSTIEYSR